MSQFSPIPTYKISISSNTSPLKSKRQQLSQALSNNFLTQSVKGNPKALPQTMKSLNSINKQVSNVQSCAMQHFQEKDMQQKEDNFSACYYLNSYRKIENQTQFEMNQIIERYRSSNLAASEVAKELYSKFFQNQFQYSQTLQKSLNVVQQRASSYTHQRKSAESKQFLLHQNTVKKLYSNLKEISKHILNQEGETKFQRLNQQLQDKEAATVEQLKQNKLDQNDKILNNLQFLRILLSKKTDEYEILKEIEQSLKFDSVNGDPTESSLLIDSESQFQDTTMTNLSTQTKISKYQEEMKNQKKIQEQKKIEKYLNINELKSR